MKCLCGFGAVFIRLWVWSLYGLSAVCMRLQCCVCANLVELQYSFYATSVQLLCGFLISRNAPELRSMGEKKAPGVWIYSAYFVKILTYVTLNLDSQYLFG